MGDREVLESEIWKLQDKIEVLEGRLIVAGQQLQVCGLSCLELEKANDDLVKSVMDLRAVRTELRNVNGNLVATVAYLRSMLAKHGHHTCICPAYDKLNMSCLCGLNKAIAS